MGRLVLEKCIYVVEDQMEDPLIAAKKCPELHPRPLFDQLKGCLYFPSSIPLPPPLQTFGHQDL